MAQPAVQAPARTPYRVTLHQIEACNCSTGCNCQFSGYPDNGGGCDAVIGFELIDGNYGNTPMAGVRAVVALSYPKAIHEGSGRVAVFVDEKASGSQREALLTILTGQAGGMPWEALAGTIAELKGPFFAPIEMSVAGTRSSIRVPGFVELEQTPIRDAVSGEEKEVQIVYPRGGFMWDKGNVCTTVRMKATVEDLRFEHPKGYACYARTKWTNQ
jgi:hypothetical protein